MMLALALVLSAPCAASAQAEARPPEPAPPAAAAAKPAEPAPAPPAAAKPASPWKSLVNIYGTLNGNLQTTRAPGAAVPAQDVTSRWAVSFDSSNIGFRGGLEVNPWIGAVYQCETAASADGISTAALCNRNSAVGLAGPWGRFFYGNWDTPFKAVAAGTKADDPFLSTDVFGYNSLMGSPGFNYRTSAWSTASSSAIWGFDVRAQNSVAYWSPTWMGLSAKLAWAVNEFKNASGTQNPELFGAAVNWDRGPFSVMAAYEQHNDGFALVGINNTTTGLAFQATAANTAGTATVPSSSDDSAWRVGAGYQLVSPAGATTVGVLLDRLTLKQVHAPAGAVKEYRRDAWQVALKHRIGDHELRARYSQAGAGDCTLNGPACSTDGYGASKLALGYAYYLAADLHVYVSYMKISNQYNAQYTPIIGGASAAAGSPAVAGTTPKGADPEALGFGVRYAFQVSPGKP
jgi:predicted porin